MLRCSSSSMEIKMRVLSFTRAVQIMFHSLFCEDADMTGHHLNPTDRLRFKKTYHFYITTITRLVNGNNIIFYPRMVTLEVCKHSVCIIGSHCTDSEAANDVAKVRQGKWRVPFSGQKGVSQICVSTINVPYLKRSNGC